MDCNLTNEQRSNGTFCRSFNCVPCRFFKDKSTTEAKVIDINKVKTIEEVVSDRVGDKFIIAYMDEWDCYTFVSDNLTDMEVCYIADTINGRRTKE